MAPKLYEIWRESAQISYKFLHPPQKNIMKLHPHPLLVCKYFSLFYFFVSLAAFKFRILPVTPKTPGCCGIWSSILISSPPENAVGLLRNDSWLCNGLDGYWCIGLSKCGGGHLSPSLSCCGHNVVTSFYPGEKCPGGRRSISTYFCFWHISSPPFVTRNEI